MKRTHNEKGPILHSDSINQIPKRICQGTSDSARATSADKFTKLFLGIVDHDVDVNLAGLLKFIDIQSIKVHSTIRLEKDISAQFQISINDIDDCVTIELSEPCNGTIRFCGLIGNNVTLKGPNLKYIVPTKSDRNTDFLVQIVDSVIKFDQ